MRSPLRLVPIAVALAACTTSNKSASDTTVAKNDTMSTAAAPQDEGAAKDAIAKLRSSWKEAADRKDSAAVAAMYADDATIVTTESPITTGRGDIEKALGGMFRASKVESVDSKETVVNGDLAYDYGTFRQTFTTPDGKTKTANGYFVVVLRRQNDGSWKIVRHVSTTPPTKS